MNVLRVFPAFPALPNTAITAADVGACAAPETETQPPLWLRAANKETNKETETHRIVSASMACWRGVGEAGDERARHKEAHVHGAAAACQGSHAHAAALWQLWPPHVPPAPLRPPGVPSALAAATCRAATRAGMCDERSQPLHQRALAWTHTAAAATWRHACVDPRLPPWLRSLARQPAAACTPQPGTTAAGAVPMVQAALCWSLQPRQHQCRRRRQGRGLRGLG